MLAPLTNVFLTELQVARERTNMQGKLRVNLQEQEKKSALAANVRNTVQL